MRADKGSNCTAMTSIHIRKWRPPFSRAAMSLALAPALLVLVASLAPRGFKGVDPTPRSGIAECMAIKDAPRRLACYDAHAKEQLPVPAKGGEPVLP